MAHIQGGGGVCDDRCGCASPCPGGVSCKCVSSAGVGGEGSTVDHKKCSCGEHCGCNPCTCSKNDEIKGAGKAFCKCGSGCDCTTCAA